jgi:hypothetical protein
MKTPRVENLVLLSKYLKGKLHLAKAVLDSSKTSPSGQYFSST